MHLLKLWFFRNWFIVETLNKCHWIWHASNPIYMHYLSHFDALFPLKINKMWKFGCFLNSSWQKIKKHQFEQGKVWKGLNICTYRFLGMTNHNAAMLEHCVTSTCLKLLYSFTFIFTGTSRYRVRKHGVGVKWDPRRTAAYIPSHFHGF